MKLLPSILAGAALGIAHGTAAVAGPYVNVESNSSFADADYTSTLLETHLGYEADLGTDASWYIQAGPGFRFDDDQPSEALGTGKVGIGIDVTERTNVYGELAAASAEEFDFSELSLGAKLGIKYSF